ncbi:MAG: hypothetical protein H6Q89_1560 [Myxococcaceae bacterium]|nr:hypothetical protein [Myxococcaceae bacterium]
MKRLALFALFLASAAFGTTQLVADLPALSQSAALIVVGTVRACAPRLTLDGRRIITDTEIQVAEVLKGNADGPTVVVMQPGGIVGDLGQKVEGTAHFTVGEEVVVFLDRRGADRFAVTAMAQGKFRIERSTDGKAIYAVPEGGGSSRLIDPLTQQETQSPLKAMPLAELKLKIAAALAAPAAAPVEPTRPILNRAGQ